MVFRQSGHIRMRRLWRFPAFRRSISFGASKSSHVSSGRLVFDTLLAEPGERSTRQVNNILCQAVDHDHKDVGTNRSKDVPPAVKLQQETPRHSNSALPEGELRTVDEVQLPEKVAEKEASCVTVSLYLPSDCRGMMRTYLLQIPPVF